MEIVEYAYDMIDYWSVYKSAAIGCLFVLSILVALCCLPPTRNYME